MLVPHLKALSPEQVRQHACTGKRVLQMQFVNAAHQRQIGFVYTSRP
jgi:hypothetical protein